MSNSRVDLLRSMVRFKVNDPSGSNCLIEHLTDLLSVTDMANRVLSGDQLFRSQGRAQLLEELIKLADKPNEELQELLSNPEC